MSNHIEVISESDVEQISYETAFLISKGWKRIYSTEHKSAIEFRRSLYNNHYQYDKIPNYVWIKDGATREVWYSDIVSGDRVDCYPKLIIDWFDRESAFNYEMYLPEKI